MSAHFVASTSDRLSTLHMGNDDDFEYSGSTSEEDEAALSEDDLISMDVDDVPRSMRVDPASKNVRVLTEDELQDEVEAIVREVREVLGITPGVCRILLQKFKWSKEALLDRFYENAETESFLKQHQIIPSKIAPIPSNIYDCDICCSPGKIFGLQCNHMACEACWEKYLETKLVADRSCTIQCLMTNCTTLVDDDFISSHIKSAAAKKAFRHILLDNFVETNKLYRWCPGVGCGRIVKVDHAECRPVLCSCNERFCFICGASWHEPVNCRLLKLWMKKCSDDSETSNWISANTKECPKCNATIEKDGGCNHMTCKNTACRMEFCWMCLGPWEPHGSSWYACNRFDDSASKQARDAQERSRAALQRYLFYYNRFIGHQTSLRLEYKLYATTKTKMEQMQQLGMTWIEVQFLKQAVDVLSECRRTLMYTYAFAYYLVHDNQAVIFEENQRDLEMATETLSGFLERDLDKENLSNLRQKVQDKCRYVEQRRVVLLKHCLEGAENSTWKYTE